MTHHPEWHSIESAPRDWSWIMCWGEDFGHDITRLGPNPIWEELPEYTHWMPLPTPPNAGAEYD